MEFEAGILQTLAQMVELFMLLRSAIILAALTGVLVYFYVPCWGVRRVPGPPAIPVVGHLPLLAKYGPDVFSVLAKRYGPIYRFHMGRQPLVIVADAELCREIGIQKFKYFSNRSIPSPIVSSPIHQKGLLFSREPRWSTMRNKILSIYQPSHLAKLIPSMQNFTESATENLDSKDFNFSELSLKIATDVIGKAAFGVDFGLSKPKSSHVDEVKTNSQEEDLVQEFINQHMYATAQLKMDLSASFSIILGLLIPILQEPFRQILKRIPGTMDWKIEVTNNNLSKKLDEILQSRMKDNDLSSKDFLSLILRARESGTAAKNVFTDDYIRALTYEHLLAGSASTSFTLSSVIYLVSCHPDVERKLLEDIDAFVPRDQTPTAHDLQHKFPYLDQVIKEAMRFYTASPLNSRETSAEVNIGGYTLPKGTWVWLAAGALAKDPKNFPEPDKFRPERFDPNGEEEKRRHPYAYIPFGLGPRICLGHKFALQEIKLSMIHLYRNYVFRRSSLMENPVQIDYGIVLNFRHGVKVRAIKRA